MASPRRFPPPWSIEEYGRKCFIVRDSGKQALAYIYYENEVRSALKCKAAHARRGILDRSEHRQAAECAAADIEGHPEAAEYSEPGRLSAIVKVRAL